MEISPHPPWVAELNAALEPIQQAILSTPVIEDASENRLAEGRVQDFLVAFYPIVRDFPVWLQLLLDRSPYDGHAFFEDNIRVERRHDAMWRAMGDGFGVPKERFLVPEAPISEVRTFHEYLTAMCYAAPFGGAVSATNYAVEGIAQKISEKALRGLGRNKKIGPKGRWWLEEHAKYDDEHPVHALEIVKGLRTQGRIRCRGDRRSPPQSHADGARNGLGLPLPAQRCCHVDHISCVTSSISRLTMRP